MYLGKIVELTDADELYKNPRHPYTEVLLNAVPVPDPDQPRPAALKGEIPSPVNPPSGCYFHPRCPYADDRCRQQEPELLEIGNHHQVACYHSEQVGRFLLQK